MPETLNRKIELKRKVKKLQQEEIDEITSLVDESLNPELSREEVIFRIKQMWDILQPELKRL